VDVGWVIFVTKFGFEMPRLRPGVPGLNELWRPLSLSTSRERRSAVLASLEAALKGESEQLATTFGTIKTFVSSRVACHGTPQLHLGLDNFGMMFYLVNEMNTCDLLIVLFSGKSLPSRILDPASGLQ
jgi:hypothetical protein